MTALQPLQVMQTVEGQRIAAARHAINLASGSEDEGDGGSEAEESEVEMVEASTSKTRTERRKGSVAKAKAKATPKRTTAALRNPAHLCGPLTCRVDLVRARLMEIRGAIQALEVEHEGLLVEVTEIMEELDGDDL